MNNPTHDTNFSNPPQPPVPTPDQRSFWDLSGGYYYVSFKNRLIDFISGLAAYAITLCIGALLFLAGGRQLATTLLIIFLIILVVILRKRKYALIGTFCGVVILFGWIVHIFNQSNFH